MQKKCFSASVDSTVAIESVGFIFDNLNYYVDGLPDLSLVLIKNDPLSVSLDVVALNWDELMEDFYSIISSSDSTDLKSIHSLIAHNQVVDSYANSSNINICKLEAEYFHLLMGKFNSLSKRVLNLIKSLKSLNGDAKDTCYKLIYIDMINVKMIYLLMLKERSKYEF